MVKINYNNEIFDIIGKTNLNIQQVLPYDGTVNYYGNIFTEAAANFYLDYLYLKDLINLKVYLIFVLI